MSSKATITRPASGRRKPMMCCSETDFPTPLRPRMQSVSPGITRKFTWLSTPWSPKARETFSKAIYGLPADERWSCSWWLLMVSGPRYAGAHVPDLPAYSDTLARMFQIFRRIQILKHLRGKGKPPQVLFRNHECLFPGKQRGQFVFSGIKRGFGNGKKGPRVCGTQRLYLSCDHGRDHGI